MYSNQCVCGFHGNKKPTGQKDLLYLQILHVQVICTQPREV